MSENPTSDGPSVAVLGGDLMAEARIRAAVEGAGGRLVRIGEGMEPEVPIDLLVVDLETTEPPAAGSAERVVGYYPHLRPELAAAAAGAGMEAIPRSRFFRELPELIALSRPGRGL